MSFVNWWNSLLLSEQIFYCIAIASTLFLLVETVLMLVGLGDSDSSGDGMGEAEIPDEFDAEGVYGENEITEVTDASGLEGLRIFTVRGFIAFFVVFGWVGALMAGSGISLPVTLPVAFVSGFAMMVIMAYLFRAVLKLKSSGNIDNRNALGTSGKVHLSIPPERSGEGKVHIMLQGSYVERSAVTDSNESIPTGCEVVVVGISGETDLVVKRK